MALADLFPITNTNNSDIKKFFCFDYALCEDIREDLNNLLIPLLPKNEAKDCDCILEVWNDVPYRKYEDIKQLLYIAIDNWSHMVFYDKPTFQRGGHK